MQLHTLYKDKRTFPISLSLSLSPSLSPFLIVVALLGRPPLTWIPVQTNRLALSQSARFAKQAQPARGYLRIPATLARDSGLGSGSRLRFGWSPAVVYYATTAKCCSNPGIDVSYTELLLSARRFARFRPKLISLHDSRSISAVPCGTMKGRRISRGRLRSSSLVRNARRWGVSTTRRWTSGT